MDNKKKNPSKAKLLWALIGLTIVGIFSVTVLFTTTNPILAKPEMSVKKGTKQVTNKDSTTSVAELEKLKMQKNYTAKALDPVENEAGLKATPKVLTLKQNDVFPDLNTEAGLTKLFSERVIPHPEYGAVYEYVNADGTPATPSSEQAGFQTIYIEITENYELTSIRVPIPVTVTDLGTSFLLDNQIALQTDHVNGKIILYPNEIANKTEEQLQQLVKTKSNVRSWQVEDGTSVPVDVIKTTIVTTSVGAYKAEFEITVGTGEEEQKASVQKDVVIFGADPQAYVSIAQNATLALGTSPTNLFTKFQTVNNATASNATYQFVNETGEVLEKFDTSVVGFHWAYVKMTEKTNENVTTTIKVPINVTSADTTALLTNKVMVKSDVKVILYPNETKGKSKEELIALIQSRAHLSAWNMSTGAAVPVSFTDTTTLNDSIGSYTGTIKVELDGVSATTTRNVTVFGANPQPFVSIAQNATLSLSTNPTNLFTKFQTVNSTTATNALYQFVGENGEAIDKFDTSTVGFHWAYVKMTEKADATVSTIIKVPINVTSADTTALLTNKVMVKADAKVLFYPNETKGKSKEELIALIQSRAHLSAWNMSTGAAVPVSFTDTTAVNNSIGSYTGTIKVELDGASATTTRNVTVFGADVKSPYYFKVDQGKDMAMGTNAANIFSKYQSLNDAAAASSTYEWVKNPAGDPTEPVNKFDTSKTGFHWGYIKMTDKKDTSVSTIIPVPITVTLDNQTVIVEAKAGMSFNYLPFLNVSEIKGKTVPQIIQVLTKKLAPKAWDLTTGQDLDARITKSMIVNSSRGSKEVTITITLGEQLLTYKFNVVVLPDQVFGNSTIEGWNNIPLNSTDGVITNPLNGSKMGFPERGISVTSLKNELGFIVKDSSNKGYVYTSPRGNGDGRVTDIPGVNNNVLYGSAWNRTNGIGWNEVVPKITSKYFLRKDNNLRQILIDEPNQILYVYNLSLNRNLNFTINLDMYNLSNTTKNFSMLESVDTDYYDDYVPIYALGNSSGFYMQPSSGKRFTIRLKDSRGNWLSEYKKYIAGNYSTIGVSGGTNYFNNDFSGSGSESKNYNAGQVISSGADSGYQLGAPWKDISPDEAFKTGYEIFAGDELPYMQIKANPEVFNIYPDYVDDFNTSYKLSKIPTASDHGTVYVTYPTGEEITMPFTSNSQKEFNSPLTIPRTGLPEQLNGEPGTIKSYDTSLLAINESEGPYNGLPSQDYAVKIKVYNLGAKPIPQIIKKGTTFNKKASEVIQDAVILPGHTASYQYEGDMPDTSVTGLTSVMVRMTDANQPDKTTLIKVPIQVIDETPPSRGLYIAANDFNSRPEPFQNLTESEVNKLILKKSEAIAWDVATGSSKDITLSVESTTLPLNPEQGSYKATLKAVRGTEVIKKTITIDIQSNQKVNVEFIDETGDSLHDKITFDKIIGTTIDLTEETEVQQALKSILAKNYQLVKKPDNETQIPVTSEESTVQYQFKGMLFVQSSPNFLNFGRKTLGIPFIKVEKAKYDKPLIVWDNRKNGGAWNLTATLKKPLTSQEDPSKVLPSAIRYKVSDTETVILSENVTQSIAERTHETKGQYNVSNEWDKNKSGLLLEVPSGEVLQAGGYRATILWQVEQTP
ncbi:MucBP domain-containing protein [Enterococcus caccae]|uniref:MucBP domain-containing protein n=1 Tax=Enterococcus caccae ATCC BAA-1240 TaxID=1158612 RepID=R3WPX7_9ENTE|nr:MucBP domain-containing protein [Enterococcus caccae]EOL49891.1 hypothetical protein UC7_00556 [Enterococcus caccae ATCC BAA-1240]EOT56231.1 hypothetical protein I580_03031 [Enterococcus caccae ATCC BAA-1240]OJG26591.1 hypothetical protein RU98_GL000647 [Enterococcus caccae]